VYKHYGVVCREQRQLDRAEEWFSKAAKVGESARDLLLSAETAREQAELYWLQSRNTDTLQALNAAHGWFSQLRAERDLDAVARRNGRLEERFLDVVRKWGESIESKDCYTQGHCVRVADMACLLAERAGFDQKTLFWFRIGALLHDVGKLIVPKEVLNKPAPLDDDEWRIMKRHPQAGVELLADIDFPWDVRPMVRNHHERWDGKGYPDELAGESIPLSARILCIADVYDALTTDRAYRKGFDHDRAVQIMTENNAQGHFDPTLFPLFLEWAAAHTPVTG
jgi:putative nucleotidyltransferase with HDIG domain